MAWSFRESKVYPEFHTYRGYASKVEASFTVPLPDQLGASYFGGKMVDAFKSDITKRGYQLLSIIVWEDKSATWSTRYKVEAYASEQSPFPWVIVILSVLAFLAVAGVAWSILREVSHISHNIAETAEAAPFAFTFGTIAVIAVVGLGIYFLTRPREAIEA